MFASGIIPMQANFQVPNPSIFWQQHKMRVSNISVPLKAKSGKALVSICASGLGGANGHVVVEAPPPIFQQEADTYPDRMPVLLLAGGLSPRSASNVAEDLLRLVSESSNELPILSTIFARRARQLVWRTFAVDSRNSVVAFPIPQHVPRVTPSLVFVFSGQGPQNIESKLCKLAS